jgi:hypothetical protein
MNAHTWSSRIIPAAAMVYSVVFLIQLLVTIEPSSEVL